MRIRILRPAGGVLDGVKLSRLMPGSTYEISDSVAAHLITIGAAVEVPAATPEPTVPGDDDIPPVFGGISVTQPKDRAADPLRRRRSRPRRK